MNIWDTAGQEKYNSIATKYFKGADGVIIVYDITKEETFEKVQSWMKQISNNVAKHVPIVLAGNKSDLVAQRAIQQEQGQELADQFNLPFFEMSALSGESVNEAFNHIIKKIVEHKCDNFEPARDTR